jgi:Flp pilus assembly protein TadG
MITYKNFHCFSKCRKNQKGAVAVEACFILPFLVWITFSILQYGYIMWKEVQLTNLSRDAMRYLAVTAVQNGSGDYTDENSKNPNSVYLYIKNSCGGTGIAYSDLQVTVTNYGSGSTGTTVAKNQTTNLPVAGSRVAVTLTYTMSTSNTIFLNGLVPGMSIWLNKPQSRTTEMVMEYALS